MSLEQIDAKLEKLSTKTNYQLQEVLEQLQIQEATLNEWIANIGNLEPDFIDDQQFFSAQQFKTLKKIKKILVEQDKDIKELALFLDLSQSSSSKTKTKKAKKHYFEEENLKQNFSSQNQDLTEQETDKNANQLSINFNDYNNLQIDNQDDQSDQPENALEFDNIDTNDNDIQSIDEDNQTIFDDNLINKIDPKAKITDFSNIKLYTIHPRLKEQIQHRLKCTKLNLEELNNLLKSL